MTIVFQWVSDQKKKADGTKPAAQTIQTGLRREKAWAANAMTAGKHTKT